MCGALPKAFFTAFQVVTFSSVVAAWAKRGCGERAQAAFERMREVQLEPNVITWNALIDGYAKAGDPRCGQWLQAAA